MKPISHSSCAVCHLEILSSSGSCSFLIVAGIAQADLDASSGWGFCSESGPVPDLIHFAVGRFAGLSPGFRCQNWAHINRSATGFQDWTHPSRLGRHSAHQSAAPSSAGSWTWRSRKSGFAALQVYHWSSSRLLLLTLWCQSWERTVLKESCQRNRWGCHPFSFSRARCEWRTSWCRWSCPHLRQDFVIGYADLISRSFWLDFFFSDHLERQGPQDHSLRWEANHSGHLHFAAYSQTNPLSCHLFRYPLLVLLAIQYFGKGHHR